MRARGAGLALLLLCACPATPQQRDDEAHPSSPLRVRRINAALDIPPLERIPSETPLKDGSTPERTYVGGEHHWDEPIVHTWDNVLSAEECQKIIELAKPGMLSAKSKPLYQYPSHELNVCTCWARIEAGERQRRLTRPHQRWSHERQRVAGARPLAPDLAAR
jgi:hypothetical protein